MKSLIVTKLFPNSADPHSSPFNRQQFRALSRYCDLELLATIPYFPTARAFKRWSAAGRLMDVPEHERIDGMLVHHPRYLYVPKLTGLAGMLYAASVLPAAWKQKSGVDVVLGSWAYPDGYAAIVLGRLLGVPTIVKLHGSDMNVIAKIPGARRMLQWALPQAKRIVAVSRGLRDEAVELGVDPSRIDVVPNGVDRSLFHPRPQHEARETLGLGAGKIVLYVGRLERAKGVVDLVRAFAKLRQHVPLAKLVLLGEGSARDECQGLVQRLGIPVELAGARPLDEVPLWMAASDVVVLPSYNEGCPNVVIEALACGRRVVATRVGAVVDILTSPELGTLVTPGNCSELCQALEQALEPYDAEQLAARANVIGWDDSARQLFASLERAVTPEKRRTMVELTEAA